MATKETYGLMGFVDEQGNTHIHRPITNADLVGYDNKKSKLKAEDAQAAIDELSAALDAVKPLSGTEDPTSSTKGAVGQHYTNTTTGQEFTCIAADEEKGVYTWEASGGGSGGGTLKLHAIHIKTAPAKTEYKAGETFDPAGMVITADYAIDGVVIIEAQEASDYTYPTAPLAAGDSSVTISLTKNGITMTATQAITCTKTVVPVPTFTETRFYNANTQTFNFNNEPSSSIATKTGETSGLAAGSYTTHFDLNNPDLFEWADKSFNGDVVCTIQKVTPTVTKPTVAAAMTFNGSSRALTASAGSTNYGTLQYSTDNKSWSATPPTATNAGTYTVYYRVVGDSNINDVAAVSIGTVTINKATGTLSVNPASVTLNSSTTSVNVTVTTNSDGAITATPKDSSIVKATVTGNIVKIEAIDTSASSGDFELRDPPPPSYKSGSTSVTISVAEGTNWTKPSDASVNVSAEFYPATLAECTPAQIQSASKSGILTSLYPIGSRTANITLNGTVTDSRGYDYTLSDTFAMVLIGYDHNQAIESPNEHVAHFEMGWKNSELHSLVQSSGMGFGITASVTTLGYQRGWSYATIRTNTLGTNGNPDSPPDKTIMALIPQEWRAVMRSVIKYTDNRYTNVDSASSVSRTTEYICLASEFEYFGVRYRANITEQDYQKQYKYYADGNSVIHSNNGTSYPSMTWTRSIAPNTTTSWVLFYPKQDGVPSPETNNSTNSYPISPIIFI